MSEKLVTVIMSIYNESVSELNKSINSILNQSYRNLEFIIINDNPLNKQLENQLNELVRQDSRVKVYVNNNNIGLVESLNRALGFSHGDYIARMDADDISEPSRIKKQVSCIEQKNLDLIGSSLILIDEQDVQFGTLHFPTRNEQIVRFMKYGTCLPHPTWLGKKEVFDCLHGYRKALYCEDYDFLLRVLKRGYKVGNCDGYDLRYRVRKCGISQSNYVKQYVLRKYLYKHRDIILQVDEEDILLYLNSDKFEEACLAYEDFCTVKKNVKKNFLCIFQLLKNRYFWSYINEKIALQMRNRV
ncbi:glycosyltransferase [Blautia glucerasea]|uniref:glycosyltransferase n=1 Tax=Clostridia TaxID=186801 RepID=UPI00156EE575|nr:MULTISPECIES: glycosyltransferase [Clostridia]NSD38667.1 glycosyltransferase [Blautia glucerasea]